MHFSPGKVLKGIYSAGKPRFSAAHSGGLRIMSGSLFLDEHVARRHFGGGGVKFFGGGGGRNSLP